MSQDGYKYDVAVSYAGEDRELARVIVSIAQANDVQVFFDRQHRAAMWGKDLPEDLGEIYGHQSRYCLMLISKDYCEKPYTTHERQHALARDLTDTGYILPVRIDDSWPKGLATGTAYFDLRNMTSVEVGAELVRKIKGPDIRVIIPKEIETSKVVPINQTGADPPVTRRHSDQLIDFVAINVAEECKAWELDESSKDFSGLSFRDRFVRYDDPIFDITIMSRHDKPLLLTAVGIEAVRLSQGGYRLFGGAGAEPLNLHRTYKLPLPDLIRSLAEKQREQGIGWENPVDVNEPPAFCRLPDPILIESYRPYRFGLHLFDYVNFCPTEVELFFWARTDRGEARSERTRLAYLIGSDIAPLMRYKRLLEGEEEVIT